MPVAIAPSIFDRTSPGFQSGYTPDEIAEARNIACRQAAPIACACDHVAAIGLGERVDLITRLNKRSVKRG